VNYLGGCAFVVEIPTTLGFFFTVSFRLTELTGRMFIQFRETPDSTFSFAFYDMPKIKTEIQVLVNGTEFSFFTRFFEKQMLTVFREKFVLPNMKTKWFMNGPEQPPYPWELKEGEDENTLYSWKPKTELPVFPSAASVIDKALEKALSEHTQAIFDERTRLDAGFEEPDSLDHDRNPSSAQGAAASLAQDHDRSHLDAESSMQEPSMSEALKDIYPKKRHGKGEQSRIKTM